MSGIRFVITKPTITVRIHQHPLVVEIFTRHQWMGFLERMRGYDDEVARDFSLSLIPLTRTHAIIMVKGLLVEITPEVVSRITTLPLGLPWRKQDNGNNTLAKKKLFLEGEEPMEDKNGVRRGSIPYPWNEVN